MKPKSLKLSHITFYIFTVLIILVIAIPAVLELQVLNFCNTVQRNTEYEKVLSRAKQNWLISVFEDKTADIIKVTPRDISIFSVYCRVEFDPESKKSINAMYGGV